ncbi:MAG: ribonuclease E/G [Henriciella sp.]
MSSANHPCLYTHNAPGEFRAVATDADGRPCHIFIERWLGQGGRARFGAVSNARLRKFADDVQGAFVELTSGEEAFLRLKSRDGLTEGALCRVQISSEARRDKLARVTRFEGAITDQSAFELWRDQLPTGPDGEPIEEADFVAATIDDALSPSLSLPKGGRLHIERTRALTAVDIDTAGRAARGSAGARALSINSEAAQEMARQISLRGLGGNVVLDCVGPLNAGARDQLQSKTQAAFKALGLEPAKTLKPSPLGLMEVSVPWRFMPLADQIEAAPAETDLLALLREADRVAAVNPMQLYELSLGGAVWQAYLERRTDADAAIEKHFGARLSVSESPNLESRMRKR